MTEPETINLPKLGAEGEPCGSCGSPLASDQRYCLSCGTRRGTQRVDVEQDLNTTGAEAPVTAVTAATVAPGDQRIWTPFAIVGSLATLGTMLILGVLIGKEDSGTVAAAPAASPVVLDTTGGTSTGQAADTSGGDEAKKSGGKDKGGSKDEGEELAGDAAVNDQLDNLAGLTGEDYAKEAAKLPDEIAIPGKPPPADNKEPGGGSDAIVIE